MTESAAEKSAALSLFTETRLTNRDNSPVWALFCFIGYDGELFICATQGEIRAAGCPAALKNYCVMTSPMGYSISYSARYICKSVASEISNAPSWFMSAA